jgi:hypothetical protein
MPATKWTLRRCAGDPRHRKETAMRTGTGGWT